MSELAFCLTLFCVYASGMETGDFRLHTPSARMVGPLITKTLPRLSLLRCAAQCARDRSLLAFNYNPSAKLCELIGENGQNLSGTLTNDSQYNYYVRLSANSPSCISPDPCLYGSRYVPSEDGTDYSCLDCPAFFGGKNCGELMCGGEYNCSLFNDTVYWGVDLTLAWAEADQWCVNRSMTLATPKDNATNDFLANFLRSVYGSEVGSSSGSWIGLKSDGSDWWWVDGSPLGDFVRKNPNLKIIRGAVSVALYVRNDADFWNALLSATTTTFVCQRRIDQPPPCTSDPCLYGSRCVPTPNGLDYSCLGCPAYFGGKNCGDLNCGMNSCRLLNDTVYFVVDSQLLWQAAINECKCQGAILAMPKDDPTDRFVSDLLTSVYAGNSSQLLVWLGLRYDGSQWAWLDGSPLGDYVGLNPNLKAYIGQFDAAALSVTGPNRQWRPYTNNNNRFSFVCQRPIKQQPPSCVNNPCLYGSRCEYADSASDYTCADCPPYLSGKNCDVWASQCQGVACFRLNETSYVVYGSRGSWARANLTCAEADMTLAMIKEPEASAYVTAQLERLFCKSPALRFWFGLRALEAGGWQWADGSALGPYTGNTSAFAPNGVQKCASLSVFKTGTNSSRMDWVPDDCDEGPNYRYYPLCEKVSL